jgi:hypothetical protein
MSTTEVMSQKEVVAANTTNASLCAKKIGRSNRAVDFLHAFPEIQGLQEQVCHQALQWAQSGTVQAGRAVNTMQSTPVQGEFCSVREVICRARASSDPSAQEST